MKSHIGVDVVHTMEVTAANVHEVTVASGLIREDDEVVYGDSHRANDCERLIEHRKSSVRCKVEHAFRMIKCQFGYTKTRYRGLKKNKNRLYAMFACGNLYVLAMAGRKLREA